MPRYLGLWGGTELKILFGRFMARSFTLELYQQAVLLGEQLRKTFSKCFFSPGQEKPLKAGIFHDLIVRLKQLSPASDKKVIRAFMIIYTSSISYRAALIMSNAVRIDLDGNECEPVTSKERYKAKITTRKIRWTLEVQGFEVEQAKIKAKLKEEPSKKLKEIKEEVKISDNKATAVTNPNSVKQKQSHPVNVKQQTSKASASYKKPVVVVKKRKTIPPNLK